MGLFSGIAKGMREEALMRAKASRKVQKMLAKGTDPNCHDKEGWTPLLFQANAFPLNSSISITGSMTAYNPLSGENKYPNELAELDSKAREQMVRQLLEAGADLYHEADEHLCPLVLAAYRNERRVMRVFVEQPAESAKAQNQRLAALSLAAGLGHTDIVRALLDAGTPPQPDQNRCAAVGMLQRGIPTHVAKGNMFEMKDLLGRVKDLRCAAKTSGAVIWNWTPLHRAVFVGDSESVTALLEAGAEVNRIGEDGNTALQIAEAGEKAEIAEQLRAAGATG